MQNYTSPCYTFKYVNASHRERNERKYNKIENKQTVQKYKQIETF